ncbi:MAG: tRNA (adenosine(37)-N6)-threonylcarbamoyltransferase complex dimerization subunit type 1 TsaB [Chakrabartia sp.]
MSEAPLHVGIETATTACSVALLRGDIVVAHAHEEGARGHAEHLIPMIATLPEGGRADVILVNCGPGSFTGVRVGLAAARALGLAWGVPVQGYSTHALLAARLFEDQPSLAKTLIVIQGGHGEVFIQSYAARPLVALNDLASCVPETVPFQDVAAGSAAGRIACDQAVMIGPDARDARLLPSEMRTLAPSPIYGRAPDAKPNP